MMKYEQLTGYNGVGAAHYPTKQHTTKVSYVAKPVRYFGNSIFCFFISFEDRLLINPPLQKQGWTL